MSVKIKVTKKKEENGKSKHRVCCERRSHFLSAQVVSKNVFYCLYCLMYFLSWTRCACQATIRKHLYPSWSLSQLLCVCIVKILLSFSTVISTYFALTQYTTHDDPCQANSRLSVILQVQSSYPPFVYPCRCCLS